MNSQPDNKSTDIQVSNLGSIFSFSPLTESGREWLDENVAECPVVGFAVYCEHRYAYDIAEGALSDGLEVA